MNTMMLSLLTKKSFVIPGVLLMMLTMLGSVAHAKRSAPEEVKPVKSGDVEYRVPHGMMGCVEAWDAGKGRMIWRKQIYVVKYQIELEKDVQDVFITTVGLKGNTLSIKNERGSEYELDLDSLNVKLNKGSLVEEAKR